MPQTGHHTVAQCPMSPHAESGIQPPHHLIIDPSPEPQSFLIYFFNQHDAAPDWRRNSQHALTEKENLHITFFPLLAKLPFLWRVCVRRW